MTESMKMAVELLLWCVAVAVAIALVASIIIFTIIIIKDLCERLKGRKCKHSSGFFITAHHSSDGDTTGVSLVCSDYCGYTTKALVPLMCTKSESSDVDGLHTIMFVRSKT